MCTKYLKQICAFYDRFHIRRYEIAILLIYGHVEREISKEDSPYVVLYMLLMTSFFCYLYQLTYRLSMCGLLLLHKWILYVSNELEWILWIEYLRSNNYLLVILMLPTLLFIHKKMLKYIKIYDNRRALNEDCFNI